MAMLLRQTIMAAALLSAIATSARSATLPAGGAPVLRGDPLATLTLAGTQKELVKSERIDVEDQSISKALRIVVSPGATAEWNVQLVAPTAGAIKSGDVLIGHFWMRCIESMTGDGAIGFVLEQNHEPFEKAGEQRVSVGGKWTECFVPFKSRFDFDAGKAQ